MKHTLSGFLLAAGALLQALPLSPGAMAGGGPLTRYASGLATIGPHEARPPAAGLSRAVRIMRTDHVEGEDLDLRAEYSPKSSGGARAAPWSVYSRVKGRRQASGGKDSINQIRLGGNKRLSHRLMLSAETAIGEDGLSSTATGRYRANEHIQLYGNYSVHSEPSGMGYGDPAKTFSPGIQVRAVRRAVIFSEDRLQLAEGSRALTHVFGTDLAPGRHWTLRLSLEAGRRIDPAEREARHRSGRLSIGYGPDHFRYNGEFEISTQAGDAADCPGGTTRHSMDCHLGLEWRLQTGLKAAYSPSNGTSSSGEVRSEWEAGLASGPAGSEQFRLLLKYTRLDGADADVQADVRAGLYGRLTESTRFGVGYNLADFTNAATAPDPEIHGWFLEISGEL